MPERSTVEGWVKRTPAGFTFDVKLHRLLSRHSASVESLPPELRGGVDVGARGRVALTPALEAAVAERLLAALEPLEQAGKLSSLLLQLTPSFGPGNHALSELEPLLKRLAPRPVAVELRHSSWVSPERVEATLGWFEDNAAAFVCVDAPAPEHHTIMPALDAVTRGDLAYLRLHGRNGEGYLRGRTVAERFGWVYSEDELGGVRDRVLELAGRATDTRVMFNNNRSSDAPSAARRMRELVGQDSGPPVEGPQLRML